MHRIAIRRDTFLGDVFVVFLHAVSDPDRPREALGLSLASVLAPVCPFVLALPLPAILMRSIGCAA